MKIHLLIPLVFVSPLLMATPLDPYANITHQQRLALAPIVNRWTRDQVHKNWNDLWEIQEQTSELKNELLLGNKDAPDMTREQYVAAMRETMGTGYWVIQKFSLFDIKPEKDGFVIIGCGKLKREEWQQTSITYVHVRMANGKLMFGLPGANPDSCKL